MTVYTKILESRIQLKKRKILIIFGDMIADMLSNKKFNLVVTELFITGRKLNISFVFITNCMHYFIMTIPNKQELQ